MTKKALLRRLVIEAVAVYLVIHAATTDVYPRVEGLHMFIQIAITLAYFVTCMWALKNYGEK